MAQINNGDILSYTGTWTRETLATADGTVSDVLTALQSSGLVSRATPNISAGILTSLPFGGGKFSVTLSFQVENGLGFGSVDDAISLIRNAVYSVTGAFPDSDSIPYVQSSAPGSSPSATGQPAAVSQPGGGCVAGTSNDLTGGFSLSCWFSNLTSKGLSTVGLLTLLILAGVAIAFGIGRKAGA